MKHINLEFLTGIETMRYCSCLDLSRFLFSFTDSFRRGIMLISEYVKQHTKEQVKFRDGELWLEKCPICGGEAKLYIASRLDPPCHYTVAFVRCTKCRIRTDDIIVDGYDGSTDIVNDAIGYWNDRPVEPRVKRIYI